MGIQNDAATLEDVLEIFTKVNTLSSYDAVIIPWYPQKLKTYIYKKCM